MAKPRKTRFDGKARGLPFDQNGRVRLTLKRHVWLDRGEEAKIVLALVPNERFQRLAPDDQKGVLEERNALSIHALNVSRKTGEIDLPDHIARYFDVQVDEGEWTYSGGDVGVLDAEYTGLKVI